MYPQYDPGGPPMPGPRRRRTFLWVMLGFLVVLAVIVVVVVLSAFTGVFGSSSAPHPLFGFWGGFLLLFLILWIAFFAVRVVWWTSRARGRAYGRGPGAGPGMYRDPARMIARQRYARGEISREQYDQIMTDLERRRGPSS